MIVRLVDFNNSTIKVMEKLYASSQAIAHLEPVFKVIAADMMRVTRMNFQSEGRRGGGSWQPLSERYALNEGRSRTVNILRRSDEMFRSLTETGAPHQVLRFHTGNVVEYGTTRQYSEIHQFGGGNNVPARPFLKYTPHDLKRWNEWMADFVNRTR